MRGLMEAFGVAKLLSSGGLFPEEEVDSLVKEGTSGEEPFLSFLIKKKKLEPSKVAAFLASRMNLAVFDLDFLDLESLPRDLIENKLLDKHRLLGVRKTSSHLFVLTSDPTNSNLAQELRFGLKVQHVIMAVVEDDKLTAAYVKLAAGKTSNFSDSIEDTGDVLMDGEGDEDGDQGPTAAQQADADAVNDDKVVKFVQNILLMAVREKVSDIHFEPYEKFYRIRFRKDGILEEKTRAPLSIKEKVASRIKVVSRLDISEKRVPQDGRMKIIISKDRSIDFRVSVLPTLWGEKIVMRILDNSAASLNIDALGYDELQKKRLLESVHRPYGMVLVTGPTGSGKTVSLYSCVNILNKDDINIATAEDPAEINLAGINQVNVNVKAGLTFAEALKSFLRQDPDIIMVGEIRDLETADIAIKAAQTGHLVLSTLHTNDAPSTLTRLLNMGVKPFNIASSVIMITAQRLARKLCFSCKKEEIFPEATMLQAGFEPDQLVGYGTTWKTYKPVGCPDCNNRGYKGRVGVYQVMPITEEIQKIILREGTTIEISEAARANQVLNLRMAGLEKVKDGLTSLEEIEACTNLT